MAAPNFANRTLYHGDNLPFLRGMNSETVHLIATDPPFNKNKDFHATPDSLAAGARFTDRWRWDKDVHPEWVDAIQDDWPAVWRVIEAARAASGDDMAAFLAWLGVRLMEMHRILTEDGSLYLHIDHTAHAWVKALLDAIFGRRNFRNEIVWCYSGGGIPRRDFPRKHDTLLRYTKSDDYTFYIERKPYKENTQQVGKRSTYSGGDDIDLERGTPITDWWTDIQTVTGWNPQRTGFRTQKPLELYERIIRASSNEGDVVLDPFCGCATTPVAAERLGRQWIGMDIWDRAHDVVIQRLQDEGLAGPNGETNGRLLTFGQIGYNTAVPVRTDDREVAAPVLRTKTRRIAEPPGPRLSRDDMIDILLAEHGLVCAGCDREFDDHLYLELDHNTPRSDGGLNHISNRLLLCGPCNRIKSNTLTLSGLRKENARRGRMASQRET